jgi:hypothetical protein
MDRISCVVGDLRVCLHKTFPCEEHEPLYHSHPWDIAVKLISGRQEVHFGVDNEVKHNGFCDISEIGIKGPEVSKVILFEPGDFYFMPAITAWHYVFPLGKDPTYTIMVNGPQVEYRERPENFGAGLTDREVNDYINEWEQVISGI